MTFGSLYVGKHAGTATMETVLLSQHGAPGIPPYPHSQQGISSPDPWVPHSPYFSPMGSHQTAAAVAAAALNDYRNSFLNPAAAAHFAQPGIIVPKFIGPAKRGLYCYRRRCCCV